MIVFKKSGDVSDFLKKEKSKGKKIGFVPTMGALHPGHISLIENSIKENEFTSSSIFINPTQFNDPKDFENYPVTLEKDIYLLEASGCDALFLPSVDEIYSNGKPLNQHYDLGFLETILEGKYRPGHFQGVCQVMDRLLEIVVPDRLYIGQKDYQQCMVIARLNELTGRAIQIRICPTLREDDGLAMSSRNLRLPEDGRKKAEQIFAALSHIKENLKPGSLTGLKHYAVNGLTQHGFKVDYVEIADAESLRIQETWDGKSKLVALAAGYLNSVRLIDNLLLN